MGQAIIIQQLEVTRPRTLCLWGVSYPAPATAPSGDPADPLPDEPHAAYIQQNSAKCSPIYDF